MTVFSQENSRRVFFIIGFAILTVLLIGNGVSAIGPTTISSCTELASIDDIPANASASYTLANDIDCDGVIFESLIWGTTPFAGTFDGAGFEIQNLTINSPLLDEVGLFSKIDGATIMDLELNGGSVTGKNSVGGLAGTAVNGLVTGVTSSLDVNAGVSVGGLMGEMNNLALSNSSVAGNINADRYVGGLVGLSYGDAIDKSFVSGNVTGVDRIGGLIGFEDADTNITDSYMVGNVTGDFECGGIVGDSYWIEAYRVYFAGLVTCDASDSDPFVGYDNDTYDFHDSFWDLRGGANQTTTLGSLYGASAGKTTAEMKEISTFTADLGLITPWNFATVWDIDENLNNGYPYLRWQTFQAPFVDDNDGIPESEEGAAPNAGDANNDGTADSEQPKVTSLVNVATSDYSVLETAACAANNSVSVEAESGDLGKNDDGYDYPAGLLNFTLTGCVIGGTETITQYHYGVEYDNLSDLILRKYNPADDSYTTVDGAALSEESIGGKIALKVVYQVTDGGELDQDSVANGVIVDPSGVALGVETLAETGVETWLLPIAGVSIAAMATTLVYITRQKIARIIKIEVRFE